jgi:hypothetical protein
MHEPMRAVATLSMIPEESNGRKEVMRIKMLVRRMEGTEVIVMDVELYQ